AWQLPNGTKEAPMLGKYLSPATITLQQTNSTSVKEKLSVIQQIGLEKTEESGGFQIKIYPNPIISTGSIILSSGQAGVARLKLYDVQNRFISTIFTGLLEKNSNKAIIFNSSRLPTGTYFIHYSFNNINKTTRIVIAR
ncbi:T9SS type A sorting domain-containing protein, partial [Segetibacter aerophilus]|uniref:T9SS type A sorting domain-containing protein n=1 Tax=Segetibacter aerophilus TaxID=670293 RepID=UPI0011BDCB69